MLWAWSGSADLRTALLGCFEFWHPFLQMKSKFRCDNYVGFVHKWKNITWFVDFNLPLHWVCHTASHRPHRLETKNMGSTGRSLGSHAKRMIQRISWRRKAIAMRATRGILWTVKAMKRRESAETDPMAIMLKPMKCGPREQATYACREGRLVNICGYERKSVSTADFIVR